MTIHEKCVGSFTDKATGIGVEIVVSGGTGTTGTKSMGLILRFNNDEEVEAVIDRLRQRHSAIDASAEFKERWMRESKSYAILIGGNIDGYRFPATQADQGKADALWETAWEGIKEATGKDLDAESKRKIIRLAKGALNHMCYGATLRS